MSVTIQLILLGIFGILMHQLKKYKEKDIKQYGRTLTAEDIKLDKTTKRKKTIVSIIFNILGVVAIVILREDIESMYPITNLTIFVTGWWGDSLFMGLMKTKKPSTSGSKI